MRRGDLSTEGDIGGREVTVPTHRVSTVSIEMGDDTSHHMTNFFLFSIFGTRRLEQLKTPSFRRMVPTKTSVVSL